MHICFISREYPPSKRGGGIASYVKEVAHGLHELGHQVTVIAASDDTRQQSDEIDNGIRVIRLSGGDFVIRGVEKASLYHRFRFLYRFLSYRKSILKTIRNLRNIDLIEVPEYGAEGYFLKKIGIPVITRLHTPAMFDRNSLGIAKYHGFNKIFSWIGKKELDLIMRSQYLSSCSQALADWTMDNLNVEKSRIKVIFNPVALPHNIDQKITNEEFKDSQGAGVKPSIVFVGTISDVKGCNDLFEAGQILAKRKVDFDMYLYGKMGEYAKRLKLKEKGNNWFHVMGKVDREHVYSIYQQATVVCFPSWWDNMPMVCLEAMGVGAIVLGSSSGGMREIIEDGKSGYLIEPHNPQKLADKLLKLLQLNADQRKMISVNAKQRIMMHFEKSVVLGQMVNYYHDVISDYKKKNESTIL